MRVCCGKAAGLKPRPIEFPGTDKPNSSWDIYNTLIEGIPEEYVVTDYCLGTKWSYVEADCGMGVSWTATGGTSRNFLFDLRGLPLKEVAKLAKSWSFEESTLGIAAMNAYYARRELLDPLGALYDEPNIEEGKKHTIDAFSLYKSQMEGKNVVIVGHFPHSGKIAEYANVTVLERNVHSSMDTPDPACEYVMPDTDFAFITGVTLTNKTAPRLLQLSKNATTVMLGPSAVMSPVLFDYDVDMIAGSIVDDPEKVRFEVKNGSGKFFGTALCMTSLMKPE